MRQRKSASRLPKGDRGAPSIQNAAVRQVGPSRVSSTFHSNRVLPLILSGVLVLAIALVYLGTLACDFVNFDDQLLTIDNRHVTEAFSLHAIAWAFTTDYQNLWYPMTWLSYMLDFRLYGPNPSGYHLTNILLHAATTVLLFHVLFRMTCALWPSFLVAALFAVHPLQVETVAWIGERKGVLSGLFFMLALEAYLSYVRRPFSIMRYAVVCAAFALGLMSKPVLVTMPAVLLLLDVWPLKRVMYPAHSVCRRPAAHGVCRIRYLLAEKLPLILLVAGSCAMTIWSEGKNIRPVAKAPLAARVEGVLVSYATYLVETVHPVSLIPFYPRNQGDVSAWKVIASIVLLVAISAAAIALRRKCPALVMGWLWFLGIIFPTIGVMPIGHHGRADRYMYLPLIGLAVAAVWITAAVAGQSRFRRRAMGVACFTILVIFMAQSSQQASHWRSREILWTYTLTIDSANSMAQYGLGNVLSERGETDAGIAHYLKAVELQPDDASARYNLARLLGKRGDFEAAMLHYREELKVNPDDPRAYNDMGLIFAARGRFDEAVAHYQIALDIDPNYVPAHLNLGRFLASHGQLDAAIPHFQKVLEIKPDHDEARQLLEKAQRLHK